MRSQIPAAAAISIAIHLAFATGATACNIPVFRYALERWKPDVCEVVVFHDRPLSPQHSTIVDRMTKQCRDNQGNANAKIIRVDLNDNADANRVDQWEGLRQNKDVRLPHVLVRTKLGRGRFINHWDGPLEALDQTPLFQSPARTEIRDRLLSGHSVVWLLIRSSDNGKTNDAKKLAEESFQTLASKVKLPEGIGLPGSELYSDIPLVLKFSLIEVDANDPKEAFLIRLLTGLRKQAFDDGEPLLVPVFGRGRALEVIPGRDMSARLMQDLTLFLSGACSCQVKEQNPGFDLLISADWDGELFGDQENRPPDRSDQEGRNRRPKLLTIPPGRR